MKWIAVIRAFKLRGNPGYECVFVPATAMRTEQLVGRSRGDRQPGTCHRFQVDYGSVKGDM